VAFFLCPAVPEKIFWSTGLPFSRPGINAKPNLKNTPIMKLAQYGIFALALGLFTASCGESTTEDAATTDTAMTTPMVEPTTAPAMDTTMAPAATGMDTTTTMMNSGSTMDTAKKMN